MNGLSKDLGNYDFNSEAGANGSRYIADLSGQTNPALERLWQEVKKEDEEGARIFKIEKVYCRVISRHKLVENHFIPIMRFYLGDDSL